MGIRGARSILESIINRYSSTFIDLSKCVVIPLLIEVLSSFRIQNLVGALL